jgi:hypothetical protein
MTDELLFHLWLVSQTTGRDINELIEKWNAGRLWVPECGGYNKTGDKAP